MSNFKKLSVQVPEVVKQIFINLEHGQKQLACTAGLIWYLNLDEETQRLYRIWAQAIAEGYATIEDPPELIRSALKKQVAEPGAGAKKGKR